MLVEYTPSEPRWQAAISKAETHATNRVTFGRTMAHDGEATDSWFYVASATAEGEFYVVVVSQYQGDTATQCTCKAGEFGRPCWHAAACLIRLGVHTPTPVPAVLAAERLAVAA